MTRRTNGRPRSQLLVAALLAVAVPLVAVAALWTTGRLDPLICGGQCSPAMIVAPKQLVHPVLADIPVVGAAPSRMDRTAVRSTIEAALAAAELGPRVGVAVADLSGQLIEVGQRGGMIPASTTKLLTGFAALSEIGADHRFSTRVVEAAGRVVLVGGGDPYLSAAQVAALAADVAVVLRSREVSHVAIGYDDSLFVGPALQPSWPRSYLGQGVIAPVTALALRASAGEDPPLAAVQVFAGALAAAGIAVDGPAAHVSATGHAPVLATVHSSTLAQILDDLEQHSDNQAAEVVARHVALASAQPASFAGSAAAVARSLAGQGIDVEGFGLVDGSGLSRDNRVPPRLLAQVVIAAAQSPAAAQLLSSLPVAGVSGSLAKRFGDAPLAAGLVHAKTGTLRGVHALAGVVVTADGQVLAFAVMADRTVENDAVAQTGLDSVVAALAACACGVSHRH